MSSPTSTTGSHTDLVRAAVDTFDALVVATPEELTSLVHATLHSCEPEHQVIAELSSPAPELSLTLVVDLDIDTTATAGELIGTVESASHRMLIYDEIATLQAVVDLHFAQRRNGS